MLFVTLQEQKEAYRQYRRTFHGDVADMFDRRALGRAVVHTVPYTLGPTPFSSMSNAATVAMATALNRTQPVAG